MNRATRERYKRKIYTQEDLVEYAKLLEEALDDLYKRNYELEDELNSIPRPSGGQIKISQDTRDMIRRDRRLGDSIQEIANEYNISVGSVYKIVKDIKIDLRKNSNKK